MVLFCTVANLRLYVFDVETKVLDTENFPPDTITDLNTGITLILFGQEKPLQ